MIKSIHETPFFAIANIDNIKPITIESPAEIVKQAIGKKSGAIAVKTPSVTTIAFKYTSERYPNTKIFAITQATKSIYSGLYFLKNFPKYQFFFPSSKAKFIVTLKLKYLIKVQINITPTITAQMINCVSLLPFTKII